MKAAWVLAILYGNLIGEVKGLRYEHQFTTLESCQAVEGAYRKAGSIAACVPLQDAILNGYKPGLDGAAYLRENVRKSVK